MENPFEIITGSLNRLETLLLDLSKAQKKPKEQDDPEKLLTIQEVAELLNLSVPTIYSKVSKGELPVMKFGKKLYFSYLEILAFLKQGRKKTNYEIQAEAEKYLNNPKK